VTTTSRISERSSEAQVSEAGQPCYSHVQVQPVQVQPGKSCRMWFANSVIAGPVGDASIGRGSPSESRHAEGNCQTRASEDIDGVQFGT